MTEKTQTLAERIRAKKKRLDMRMRSESRPYFEGKNDGLETAAALADAAATTTPVVVGEQAGDVRQAVKVKPLVWVYHGTVAATWTAKAPYFEYAIIDLGRNWDIDRFVLRYGGVRFGAHSTEEAAQAAAQADYAARITAALEPDPTPAPGWRAMQTAAERAAAQITLIGSDAQQQHASLETSLAIRDAIRALPGPTDEQLLAEAVRLPQWQAMVKCLDREKSLIWIIENTVQVLIRNLALEMLGQQRAALKAWRDSQRQPSEYEQKLAAMKKDFPNGI